MTESTAPSVGLMIGTFNAAATLERTIASCAGVDEIVVVDMHSTDGTAELARRSGARVVLVEHAGYVEPGRQAGLDAMHTDWVIVLDADELLLGGIDAVRDVIAGAPDDVAAFRLPRPTYIGDQRLYGTGWGLVYERQVRLLRSGRTRWPHTIHAVPEVDGVVAELPAASPVAIEHRNFQDLADAFRTFNRYSAIEALELVEAGKPASWRQGLLEGIGTFVDRYEPEVDGWASLGLSLGLWWYRVAIHLQAGMATGAVEPPPDPHAMERAWHAFADALPVATGGEDNHTSHLASDRLSIEAQFIDLLRRHEETVEHLAHAVDQLVATEQQLVDTREALAAADAREEAAREQLQTITEELAALRDRPSRPRFLGGMRR